MQSIRQYQKIQAQVRDICLNTDVAKLEQWIDTDSSTPVEDGEKLPSTSLPPSRIPGVQIRHVVGNDGQKDYVSTVGWDSNVDPMKFQNWSLTRRWVVTMMLCLISMMVAAASSIDAAVEPQSSQAFHVKDEVGTLTTGCYLFGFAIGSLVAGSFSETFGRNIVYIVSGAIFMIFIMAKALAPNFGAALAFRFLAAFFGSTPLTCAGGSIADLWSPLEATFSLPFMMITAYAGPMLGPVISAYMGESSVISWRWADWIMLIFAGVVMALVFLFQPETYEPLLLSWKAAQFRKITGDNRFKTESEATQDSSLWIRLRTSIYRPFLFTYTEPIIMLFTLYLIIIYIILFTFMSGYPYIFQEVYGISQGLTNVLWVAQIVGDLFALPLIPLLYSWTKKEFQKATAEGKSLKPEVCLYYSMMGGSIFLLVSLFWMGWTCYSDISIWSPLSDRCSSDTASSPSSPARTSTSSSCTRCTPHPPSAS